MSISETENVNSCREMFFSESEIVLEALSLVIHVSSPNDIHTPMHLLKNKFLENHKDLIEN